MTAGFAYNYRRLCNIGIKAIREKNTYGLLERPGLNCFTAGAPGRSFFSKIYFAPKAGSRSNPFVI
jgi:hypothetical protein